MSDKQAAVTEYVVMTAMGGAGHPFYFAAGPFRQRIHAESAAVKLLEKPGVQAVKIEVKEAETDEGCETLG